MIAAGACGQETPASPPSAQAKPATPIDSDKSAETEKPSLAPKNGKKKARPAAEPRQDDKKPEEKSGDKPTEQRKPDEGKEKNSVTKHTLKWSGKKLDYTATAGTLTLQKAGGEPRANVFYVAYTAGDHQGGKKGKAKLPADSPNPRPITFCFNGGPGSSAVWLHLGAFGPRRVVLPDGGTSAPKPPFQLTDNEFTLLESTDLVFIDPVSTGYSRPEKGEDPKQFHGYNEDVQSVGDFIRLYVSRQQRWQSPKFLMGESYGAIRAAGLAEHLQDRYGMYLNGVIIVSGLFDFQTLQASPTNDLPYIVYLPSMTAVAFYHKKLAPELQKDFAAAVKAADEFAHGPYAGALLKGAGLTDAERQAVAGMLSRFTSLPADWILRENLRISSGQFFRKLLENEKRVIGRFDGRVVGDPEVGDPSYSVVFGAFSSTFNAYVRGELGFENDQPYEILTGQVHPWNYQPFTNRYVSVTDALTGAIKANPALKVYVACGHYDLATPFAGIRYSVNHLELEESLRHNFHFGFYEGGHMMYTNLPELQKLQRELTEFIKAAE